MVGKSSSEPQKFKKIFPWEPDHAVKLCIVNDFKWDLFPTSHCIKVLPRDSE